jgi:hypothetical protein
MVNKLPLGRMSTTSALLSVLYLLVGVVFLSLLVSYVQSPPKQEVATVVVESPYWYNYPRWWGYGGGYGGGYGYGGRGGHHGGGGHGGGGGGGGGHH